MHFFVVCVADTLSATVPAHIPQFFPTVEDAQRKQHSAVEQNADCKDQLKVAPFRTGCSAKAHNTQMPQPVCDRDREQVLHPAAGFFFPAQLEPYPDKDQEQGDVE